MRNSQLSSELCYRSRREDETEATGKSARLIAEVEGQSWAESLFPIACVFQDTRRKAVVSEVPNESLIPPCTRRLLGELFFFHHLLCLFSFHYLASSLLLFGFAIDWAQRAFLPGLSLLFMLSFAEHTTLCLLWALHDTSSVWCFKHTVDGMRAGMGTASWAISTHLHGDSALISCPWVKTQRNPCLH